MPTYWQSRFLRSRGRQDRNRARGYRPMPAPFATGSFAAERTRLELQVIKETVAGVHGSLVATSDGLLAAHDLPDSEPAQIAALAATTRALAASTTLATGRGVLLAGLARASHGYLVGYAAARTAH